MNDTTIRFDPNRPDDFLLIAEVGERSSPDGQTRTEVTGSGKFLIAHASDERELALAKPIYGEIDRETAMALFVTAAQFDWTQKFPQRRGIPDEAIVDWWLRDGEREVHLRAWLRDVEKEPIMSRALGILRRAVERASDGRLYL